MPIHCALYSLLFSSSALYLSDCDLSVARARREKKSLAIFESLLVVTARAILCRKRVKHILFCSSGARDR